MARATDPGAPGIDGVSYRLGGKKYVHAPGVTHDGTRVGLNGPDLITFLVTILGYDEAIERGLLVEAELTELDRLDLRHQAEREALIAELAKR